MISHQRSGSAPASRVRTGEPGPRRDSYLAGWAALPPTARAWPGLPGLTDGAPADLVVPDEDPVAHPDTRHHPRRIILRGQVLA